MKTKTITLSNDFHNTAVTVRVPIDEEYPIQLSKSQTRRIENALCGMIECECGGVRGPQEDDDGKRIDLFGYEDHIGDWCTVIDEIL